MDAVFVLYFYLFIFWPHGAACRILVPQPGIEPVPPAVEARSFNYWAAREVPQTLSLVNTSRCCRLKKKCTT